MSEVIDEAFEVEDLGLWLGTKASAYEYLKLKPMVLEKNAGFSEILSPEDDGNLTTEDDECEDDPLLEMVGSVGIISVEGVLVSGEYCRWYNWGLIGYDDIRRAAMIAKGNGATEIVFKLRTPGGMVEGLGACSTFLAELNKTVKCTFYCDSSCASAGVWLACSVGPMIVGQYAEVGNVGVMRLLVDSTKMYKDAGISFDILKSTELKGAGDARIKLTASQKEYMQQNVDKWANLFVAHLASNLRMSEDAVRSTIAVAKDWVGPEAVAIGLASKVMSFDKLIASKMSKGVSTPKNVQQSTMRFAMTLPITPAEGEADDSLVVALEAQGQEPENEVPVTPVASKDPEPTPEPVTGLSEMTKQLVALASENAETKLKLAAAEAEKASLAAQVDAVKPILREVAQGFHVKLGRPAPSLDNVELTQLVGMVTDLRAEFKKAIPVGQKSQASSESEEEVAVDKLTTELTSRQVANSIPRKKGK